MFRALAFVSVFVLSLSLLAGGAAATPQGDGNDGNDGNDRLPGRYIVVLDHGDPSDVAAEHRRDHGAEVRHVYRHALQGYSARMSETAAARISRDDRVAYVEIDREVTVAHHACDHTGGPPGSGPPPDCEEPLSGDVFGTVTDSDGGAAIENATVTLGSGETATTGSDGSYLIENVAGGSNTATADATDYDPLTKEFTVDGDTRVDFALSATSTDDGGSDDESDDTVPWGIARVGAIEAHASRTGNGTHTYILDTGIDLDHRDLHVGGGLAIETCKGGGCSADYDDDHGHGTHVAGTAGALDNGLDVVGVAPATTLWAVKVLHKNGSGSLSGIVKGIDWVAGETRARGTPSVANLSLGASGSKTGTCTDTGFDGSDSFHEALCNAKNDGVVFAVAAGNSGVDAARAVPAAYDDAVITVSATDDLDRWTSWSNWGDDTASWTSNKSAPVALAAPGASVLSTRLGGGTTTKSGTSMSAPHVAGGVALFLAANPQSANGSAFTNARSTLLSDAESTAGWNTAGNPHDEDFLDVR